MGWKGFVRSVNSSINKMERESKRNQRALEKQQLLEQRLAEHDQAALEVNIYENFIDRLISLHKESSDNVNWANIYDTEPPSKPELKSTNEDEARSKFENFKPGMFDKLLKKTDKRLQDLEQKIEEAKNLDNSEYKELLGQYENEYADWEESKQLAISTFPR